MVLRSTEDVGFPNVPRGPRFGGELEALRLLEIWILVLGHPASIVQQAGLGVFVHRVQYAALDLQKV
jgi:hypothetical protein